MQTAATANGRQSEHGLSPAPSFRHFLSTAKLLPDFIKIRFINYVNFTSRVLNVLLGGDVKNLDDTTDEIRNINPSLLENKQWLLEQISKIER